MVVITWVAAKVVFRLDRDGEGEDEGKREIRIGDRGGG